VQGSVQAERALDCRPGAFNEHAESCLWEQRFELMRLGEHWIGRSLMYEQVNASIYNNCIFYEKLRSVRRHLADRLADLVPAANGGD
jgi:hypothetical protein